MSTFLSTVLPAHIGTGYATTTSGNPIIRNIAEDYKTFRYGKEGHYGYPNFPTNRAVGGPMYLEGVTIRRGLCPVGEIWGGGPLEQRYEGSVMIDIANTGAWGGTFLPDAWGAEAFARMKPTKPNMSGLNAIYELREVPGMLRQRFLENGLSSIGSYWLALKFGWEPLLRDVRSFVSTQMDAQKRLKQLLRDNGKPVRRKITLLDSSQEVESFKFKAFGCFQPIFESWYYVSEPSGEKITYNREKIWASARFKYWLPDGPQDVHWKRRMLAAIFGLNPSPRVVYNAIPWSWLIDWFSNVGFLIENLDAGVADRLAADYMYIMRQKEWAIQQRAVGTFRDRYGQIVTASGTSQTTAFVKTRGVGDPFGFATSESSLSGMQLSILGALGLSRLR